MRRVAICVLFLIVLASCDATNRLDKYRLRDCTMLCTSGIDPVPEDHAGDAFDDPQDSTPFLAKLGAAIVIELLESHPDPMMRDSTLAGYFQDGFESELYGTLGVSENDPTDSARYRTNIHITDCDLDCKEFGTDVRFHETLDIQTEKQNDQVFFQRMITEVPLRYCGRSTDTVSIASDSISEVQYRNLSDNEKYAALQCAAYAGGQALADSLTSLSRAALRMPVKK